MIERAEGAGSAVFLGEVRAHLTQRGWECGPEDERAEHWQLRRGGHVARISFFVFRGELYWNMADPQQWLGSGKVDEDPETGGRSASDAIYAVSRAFRG